MRRRRGPRATPFQGGVRPHGSISRACEFHAHAASQHPASAASSQHQPRLSASWAALVEADDSSDRTHVVALKPGVQKIKGIGGGRHGRHLLGSYQLATASNSNKRHLYDYRRDCRSCAPACCRRAQTISAKDAGFILGAPRHWHRRSNSRGWGYASGQRWARFARRAMFGWQWAAT